MSIALLFPCVHVWIQEAGRNILLFSDVYWNDCSSAIGQGGTNYIESELGNRSPTGSTPWRWMYWLNRLHEIEEAAKEANEGKVEDLATEAIEAMVKYAQERNARVLRAYENGGDALHQD